MTNTNPKHCQFCRMHNSGDHVVGCPNAKYPSAMPLEFMECDTCRAKPGSPPLCAGCLHNRYVIDELRISDKDAWDPTTGRWIRTTLRKGTPMMSPKSFTKLYEELNKNPDTRPEPYEGEEMYHYVRRMADYLEYKLSIVEDRIVKPDSAEAASKPEAAPMLLEDISYEGEGWAILQCGAVTVKLGYTLLNIIVTCLGIGTRTANADAMLDTVRVMDAFIAVNNEAAEGHTPPDWSEQ